MKQNNDQQLVSELMKPRWKVIADYPETLLEVGKIIAPEYYIEKNIEFYNRYPHLFKKLEWWEHRSLEIFRAIKYAKVTTYRHYWLVGDIVEVTALYLGSPKDFYGFDLKGKQHAFCDVEPATSTEYLNQLKKIKT